MQRRFKLLTATLAVAVLGITTSSASAATLYTTAAHTTAVPVGTVITSTTPNGGAGTWSWTYTASSWPSQPFEICQYATLSATVTQNSGGVFKATPNAFSSALNNCAPQPLLAGLGGAIVQVSGSSVTAGSNTAWPNGAFSNWYMTFANCCGPFTGSLGAATGSPPNNGVFVRQPTVAKAPVSLVLAHAGTVSGNGVSGWLDAAYTFTGASAAYSFG